MSDTEPSENEVERISAEEAKRLVEEAGYRYLDVRPPEEFAAGHPRGAENIPFRISTASGVVPNPEFVTMASAVYPHATPLVVGCKAGVISRKAAAALVSAGFTRVVELRCGFDGARNAFGQITEPGWRQQGFPVEQRAEGKSYVELKERI